MKRNILDLSIASVPFILVSLYFGGAAAGCSSAGGDEAATGGVASTTGGTSGTTGGSSTTTGGAATGECAATASVAPCSGISNEEACTMEGLNCPGLPCGLSDVGRRTCDCTNLVWTCAACTFPMDFAMCPIMEPVTTLEACAAGTSDGVACASTKGQRCASGTEVCACWPDDEGAIIWDCDRAPTFWGYTPP